MLEISGLGHFTLQGVSLVFFEFAQIFEVLSAWTPCMTKYNGK
jgi:hypothetical protein